ncbi:hypothetical protein CapIbe_011331 [Capra ibex]
MGSSRVGKKKNELKKKKSAHENISRLSRRGKKGESFRLSGDGLDKWPPALPYWLAAQSPKPPCFQR